MAASFVAPAIKRAVASKEVSCSSTNAAVGQAPSNPTRRGRMPARRVIRETFPHTTRAGSNCDVLHSKFFAKGRGGGFTLRSSGGPRAANSSGHRKRDDGRTNPDYRNSRAFVSGKYARRIHEKTLAATGLRAEMDDTGNVIGEWTGSSPEIVMLTAHLDTVFPAGTDVHVKRSGGRLLGAGNFRQRHRTCGAHSAVEGLPRWKN